MMPSKGPFEVREGVKIYAADGTFVCQMAYVHDLKAARVGGEYKDKATAIENAKMIVDVLNDNSSG
jgi:hypothetical protein